MVTTQEVQQLAFQVRDARRICTDLYAQSNTIFDALDKARREVDRFESVYNLELSDQSNSGELDLGVMMTKKSEFRQASDDVVRLGALHEEVKVELRKAQDKHQEQVDLLKAAMEKLLA